VTYVIRNGYSRLCYCGNFLTNEDPRLAVQYPTIRAARPQREKMALYLDCEIVPYEDALRDYIASEVSRRLEGTQ
jgi:hypothetical protein